MKVRRAETPDAAVLTQIAHEAKRHWGYPESWMALWQSALTISASYVADHDVFVAETDREIGGFYALAIEDGRWQLAHLWVRPARMGQGLGRQLFEHAVGRLHELAPGSVMGIEADPNAEPFYRHLGAKRVSEVTRTWQGLERVLPYLEFPVS